MPSSPHHNLLSKEGIFQRQNSTSPHNSASNQPLYQLRLSKIIRYVLIKVNCLTKYSTQFKETVAMSWLWLWVKPWLRLRLRPSLWRKLWLWLGTNLEINTYLLSMHDTVMDNYHFRSRKDKFCMELSTYADRYSTFRSSSFWFACWFFSLHNAIIVHNQYSNNIIPGLERVIFAWHPLLPFAMLVFLFPSTLHFTWYYPQYACVSFSFYTHFTRYHPRYICQFAACASTRHGKADDAWSSRVPAKYSSTGSHSNW